MRILILSNLLPPRVLGGYELACWNLAKGLRERGHEVLILTSPTEKPIEEPHDFVERTLAMRAYDSPQPTERHVWAFNHHLVAVSQTDNTRIVLDALHRFRPDHVIAFNLVGLGALAILDLLSEAGIAWTLNLGDRQPNAITDGISPEILALFGFQDGAGFRLGAHAIVSQTLADEIAEGGIDLGDRVRVITRGVRAPNLPRSRAYRAGGITRFIAASAVAEHKGIGLIVDAAALLVAQGTTNFTVEVYGDGDREHYLALTAAAGLQDRVTFPGAVSQDELFRINAGADAFLIPTLSREPFGSAPLEAASVGCVPILTADIGAAERLVDGVDCIKIERTVEALAGAMNRVTAGEIDLESLGRAGIEHGAGVLSFDTSVTELERFIRSTTPKKSNFRKLDEADLGPSVVTKSFDALTLLFSQLDAADRVAAERASGRGTVAAATRGLATVATAGARSVLRRARGASRESALEDATDDAVKRLEFENGVLRKENLALRNQLGWVEGTSNARKARRV